MLREFNGIPDQVHNHLAKAASIPNDTLRDTGLYPPCYFQLLLTRAHRQRPQGIRENIMKIEFRWV